MGWVAGNGDESGGSNKEPFPVDKLVGDILAQIRKSTGTCSAYSGQEWFCCDAMASCLTSLSRTMEAIQTEEVYTQNINRACRKTKTATDEAKECLSSASCHHKVPKASIKADFDRVLLNVRESHRNHCDRILNGESTTVSAVTANVTTNTSISPNTTLDSNTPTHSQITTPSTTINPKLTTSTYPPTSKTSIQPSQSYTTQSITMSKHTTDDSSMSTSTRINTMTISITSEYTTPLSNTDKNTSSTKTTTTERPKHTTGRPTTTVFTPSGGTSTTLLPTENDTLTGNNNSGKGSDDLGVYLAVGAVLGLIFILVVIIVVYAMKWRRFKEDRNASNGSSSSTRPFFWMFRSSKASTSGMETEIYAEIDEAFMEAVYHAEEKPSTKSVSGTKSQINMCYEAGLESEDAIISGRKSVSEDLQTPPNKTPDTSHSELNHNFPNQLQHDKPLIERFLNLHNNKSAEGQHPNILNMIRKQDDMITSFQAEELRKRSQEAHLAKEIKSYMLSRPAFTTIEQKGNTYEDIDQTSEKYDVIEEPIYAVPMDKNVYDSSNVDLHELDGQTQVTDKHYHQIVVYKNQTEFEPEKNPEENEDELVYENEDKMMEY